MRIFYARFFDDKKRRVWQGRINALEITFVNPYYFLFFSMIKKISSLKSHITSKIRNFPSKVQVLCLLLLQGEAKLKFLYEMSSHFRGELRQMGGKKKLGFYSISTLNRYKFLLKSRQFPFEVSVPERLFQCDISTWINLRLNCSATFELKRKKTTDICWILAKSVFLRFYEPRRSWNCPKISKFESLPRNFFYYRARSKRFIPRGQDGPIFPLR